MTDGRDETREERLDRKWADLLQELRVMQTGAQLTAAFLLTLPFQPSFGDLDTFQTRLYLALVLLAVTTTALVITPVAVHRRITGQHVKERLATLGLLVTGMVMLIFDVVVDRTAALVAAGCVGAGIVALLVVLPHRLTGDRG
jgi:hypothetical protein